MGKEHHEEPFVDTVFVRPDDSCLTNTVRFMGYGTIWGTCASFIVASNQTNVSFLELAGRSVVRYVFPAVLIGATFASTTCLLDSMRGRENVVSNGFLGGAMAGVALGTRTQSSGKVAKYAFMLGLIGGAARFGAVNGYYRYDPKVHLEMLNNDIPMSEVRRLAPNGESTAHE